MEEDLKILEEFIKYYNAETISRKFVGTLSISVDESDIQAIENLTKRYKELDEYYKEQNEVNAKFIPKFKIEEKIKELKHIRDTALTFTTVEIMEHKIHILKLILEESEENK